MKIYHNKKLRSLNIGVFAVMALGLMAVLEDGSFDPRTSGFWLCLLQAFFTCLFLGPISFKKTESNPDLLIGKED
jgi:hypothetical protein